MSKFAWQMASIWIWGAAVVSVATAVRCAVVGEIGYAVFFVILSPMLAGVARNAWRASKTPKRERGAPDPTASVRPWRDR